jgi:hypothetical protein
VLEKVLQGTPLEALFVAIADARGGFRFPAVPAPQGVVLNVSAEGMADLSTEVPGDYAAGFISGTAAKPARLTMEAEARVLGRIVTKLPGVSVAGLNVGLQSTNDSTMFWRDARTGPEGQFEMRGLPEGGDNLFPMDHPSDGPWAYRAIDNLALHPGKTNKVTIELVEGVLVEGKVAEATTGKPMVGVGVGMYGPARPRSGAAILSATTDDAGRYRFRLPTGETYFYLSSANPGMQGSQSVVIPTDAREFTVPTIEVRTRGARARPPVAPKAAGALKNREMEKVAVPGFVCDVSDQPVEGALIVGAILSRGVASPRVIVRADAEGLFSLELVGPNDLHAEVVICALKEGLAPAFARMKRAMVIPKARMKLVCARTRPFVGTVQDYHKRPIARAEVHIQSMKMPVSQGAGTTIVEVPWPLIRGTPLEVACSTTTDQNGAFQFPDAPARSLLNLVVTAEDMVTHRTSHVSQRDTIGMIPYGFIDGFLHGTIDAPATVYLASERQGGGRAKAKDRDDN